jgi:putative sigma-54 modulation protein
MKISVTARKMELTDAIRNYAEEKVSKLEKYMDGIVEAQVLLRVEKHWQVAEGSIRARNTDFMARDSSEDLYAAIDGLVDKLDRQMRKHKTRMLARRKKSVDPQDFESGSITIFGTPKDGGVATPIKEKILHLDRLNPNEAISRMEVHGDNFWIFTNEETGQMGLVYKRKDGTYGLIQPEE